MTKSILTQEELKRVFSYDADTGNFTRKVKTSGSCKVGDISGCARSDGYLTIRINAKLYLCHRLAWFYIYGKWPVGEVDHDNGIRHDNRIVNLNDVERHINGKNTKLNSRNKSGVSGIWWHNQNSTWCADIFYKGKKIGLGSYKNFFDAVCVRKSAELKLNYHENHGRR